MMHDHLYIHNRGKRTGPDQPQLDLESVPLIVLLWVESLLQGTKQGL